MFYVARCHTEEIAHHGYPSTIFFHTQYNNPSLKFTKCYVRWWLKIFEIFLCTSWIHTIIRKELFVQWFKYKSHINASSYINLPAEQYLTSYNFHIHIIVKCSAILFVYIHLQCILFLYPLFVVTPLNLFNQQCQRWA